jgi:hypothetical protein
MNYTAEELFNLLNEQDECPLSTEPLTVSTEPYIHIVQNLHSLIQNLQ